MAWRTTLLVSIIIILVGAVLYIALKVIPEENKKRAYISRTKPGQIQYNTNNYYYDVSGNKLRR